MLEGMSIGKKYLLLILEARMCWNTENDQKEAGEFRQ